jgi:hypothetical protein
MSELEAEISKIFIPDDLKAYINGLVEIRVEKAVQKHRAGCRTISRTECILESNRRFYDEGVRSGLLHPFSGKGRNAEHYLYITEWDAYIRSTQFKRNS